MQDFCNEETFSFLCLSCESLLLKRDGMRVQRNLRAFLGIKRQKMQVRFFKRMVLICLYATGPHTSVFF